MNYTFEELPENQAQTGWIYVIRSNVGGLIKIGITTNVERRMGELEPTEIICLKEVLNPRGIEKELHETYSHSRLSGTEYFDLDEYEIESIKERIDGRSGDIDLEEEETVRPALLPYDKEDAIVIARLVFEMIKDLDELEKKQLELGINGDAIGVAEMDAEIDELKHKCEFVQEIINNWGRLDEDGSEGPYYQITEGMIIAAELLEKSISSYEATSGPVWFYLNNKAYHLRLAKKARGN